MSSAASQQIAKSPRKTAAQLTMERETRISFGAVPHSLSGEPLSEIGWQMDGDRFLLRGEGEHFFFYSKGKGITIERGRDADLSEESLWLNGSVYAAVASMNGLLPIHASAVAFDGAAYAFTGPAGAGKSTLAAALAAEGLPMFCDDTLVLDISDPDRVMCLPGHKRLKLRPDAIELTKATAQEKVSKTVDKQYAVPVSSEHGMALPLRKLIFLEEGSRSELIPIRGADRLVRLQDDHYTADLFAGARKFDRQGRFAHLTQLARNIEMVRFVRPLDPKRFSEGVAFMREYVSNRPGT